MVTLPPISEGSFLRAAEADPNDQRCLIENFPKQRAVQLAHVLPRGLVGNGEIMSRLEWNWNLRRGTLNLDTRGNIFFLGASMKLLYENGQWALLPEDRIIDQYYAKLSAGFSTPRSEFPIISETSYTYRLIALSGMEDIALMRQTTHPAKAKGVETHLHPYHDFPKIVSHIHPKFAIMGFAHNAETIESSALRNLCKALPIVKKLMALSCCWKRMLPPRDTLQADPTYVDPELVELDEDGYDDNSDGYETDGDSICTVPRRIMYAPPSIQKRQRVPEESEDELHEDIPPLKSRRTGEKHDGDVAEDNAWSADRISEWAREVSTSPLPRNDRACI
ncbi:hypothetical protein BKA70DRAFT_1234566 [Coprinopsis sp. MPI-PUGE-AT-0042]|nr:hypothetical protein BKA70DRAFT_1234566 [Coprinopsis sp. MPI-PUGE-AT-0042]